MAIKPTCDFCNKELTEFGAILLSPPSRANNVHKYHVCKECYKSILAKFKRKGMQRVATF